MTNSHAYEADRQYLTSLTVKELGQMLTNAAIAGRSKAKTKAEKVEMLLTEFFGYNQDAEGEISQKVENTPKVEKIAPNQPTRKELAEKASIYGWNVVNLEGIYAIQHDRARSTEYMATARTLKAIARRLDKLITEWLCATVDCTQQRFLDRYYWKKAKGNFSKAS